MFLSVTLKKCFAGFLSALIIFTSAVPSALADEAAPAPAPATEQGAVQGEGVEPAGEETVRRGQPRPPAGGGETGSGEGLVEGTEPAPEEPQYFEGNDLTQNDPNTPIISSPGSGQSSQAAFGFSNQAIRNQQFVNILNGGASPVFPLAVPQGKAGLTPSFTLELNSHETTVNSPFGYGANVRIPMIKHSDIAGVPSYDSLTDAIFYLVWNGDGSGEGELEYIGTTGTVRTYGQRRERDFSRFEFDTATVEWKLTSTDGTIYLFGSDQQSRIQDGTNSARTYAWLLKKVTNTHGLEISYEYAEVGNNRYLKKVSYGGNPGQTHPFEVRFEPFASNSSAASNRTDYRSSFRTGFLIEEAHRYTSIQVNLNGQEKLRYDFEPVYVNSQLRLKKLTVVGQKPSGGTTSQDLAFHYYSPDDGFTGDTLYKRNLLRGITLPDGNDYNPSTPLPLNITYDYTNSNTFTDDQGNPSNLGLRGGISVVNSVTKTDFQGTQHVYTYAWHNGFYYFRAVSERDKMGFNSRVVNPLDEKTFYYPHQAGGFDGSQIGENPVDDYYLAGKIYRTEKFDAGGRLLQVQINKWAAPSLGTDRAFPQLTDTVTTLYGTQAGDTIVSSAVSYTYDVFGNILTQTEHGAVTAQNNGNYTDDDTDSRQTVSTYVHNATKHIHSLPATQELRNHSRNKVGKVRFRYDNLIEGLVDKGDRTHEISEFIEEARDITTVTAYNTLGLIESITDPRQKVTSATYDAYGYLQTITNALQQVAIYQTDPIFSVTTQETDPNGLIKQTVIDGLGRTTEEKLSDPNQSNQLATIRSIEYRETTLPHSIVTRTQIDAQNTVDGYAYLNDFGQLLQVREEAEGGQFVVKNTIFDDLDRVSQQTLPVFASGSAFLWADGSAVVTRIQYDPLGQVVSLTDGNGTASTDYNGFIRTVTDPNNNTKQFEVDAHGRLIRVEEQNQVNSQQQAYTTRYQYDSRDLLIRRTDHESNVSTYVYNSLGWLTSLKLHQSGGTWSYTYDNNGNELTVTDPKNQVLSYTYDDLNRSKTEQLNGSAATLITITYDQGANAVGRISSIVGPGYSSSSVFDRRGRVIGETRVIDGQAFTKTMTYTRFDQPLTITYPDSVIVTNAYNELGQLQSIGNNTALNSGIAVSNLDYNPLNQVTQIRYGNDLASTFRYEAGEMYRLKNKWTGPYSQIVTHHPRSGWMSWMAWMNDHESDAGFGIPHVIAQGLEEELPPFEPGPELNNLNQIRENGRGNVFSNPLRGRNGAAVLKPNLAVMLTSSQVLSTGEYRSTMTNPASATKYQIRIVSGFQIAWDSGWVSLATPLNPGESTSAIPYNLNNLQPGQSYQVEMAFELSNGFTTPKSDSISFQVPSRPTRPTLSIFQNISYTYDAIGNILTKVDTSGSPASESATYTYDNLHRLKSAAVINTPASQNYTQTYDFSPLGNITFKSDQGNYQYGRIGFPHAVTSITAQTLSKGFTYDDNGNLERQTIAITGTTPSTVTKTFTWNHRDEMTQAQVDDNGVVTTVTSLYDHAGQRLRKTVARGTLTQSTLYPFGDFEVTTEDTTKVSVSAAAMEVAVIETPRVGNTDPQKIAYSHSDHLGSGSIFSDDQGRFTQSLAYFPFGSVRDDKQYDDFDSTQKFTGHELDDETGLYYMNARYQDPEIGRFVSVDPLQFRPAKLLKLSKDDPQGWNVFAYAKNNPLMLVDPTGEFSVFGYVEVDGYQFTLGIVKAAAGVAEAGLSALAIATGIGGAGGGLVLAPVSGGTSVPTVSATGVALITVGAVGMGVSYATMKEGMEDISGSVKSTGKGSSSNSDIPGVTRDGGKLKIDITSSEAKNARTIAGKGSPNNTPVDQAQRLSNQYGGKPGDWVKNTTKETYEYSGDKVQKHWYENTATKQRVEIKLKGASGKSYY